MRNRRRRFAAAAAWPPPSRPGTVAAEPPRAGPATGRHDRAVVLPPAA